MNLENEKTIKKWKSYLQPESSTWNRHTVAIQYYCRYTNMTPTELIDVAKADIKAGKLMDERQIYDDVIGFRAYIANTIESDEIRARKLERLMLSDLSQKTYIGSIRSFYRAFQIQFPELPKNANKAQKKKCNSKTATIDDIRHAFERCNELRDRAIILVGTSSGMGASEACSLMVEDYYHPSNKGKSVKLFDMRRKKSGTNFITFISPEASAAVNAYLEWRDKPCTSRYESVKKAALKQKVTPDSPLFINLDIPDRYLDPEYEEKHQKYIESQDEDEPEFPEYAKPKEDLRRMRTNGICKMYERLSDDSGISTPKGQFNIMRSHNMRKFFTMTLSTARNVDKAKIEMFVAHKKNSIEEAYYNPENLTPAQIEEYRDYYEKFCAPYLTIQKNISVTDSDEFKNIEKELMETQAENQKIKVERYEHEKLWKVISHLQDQLEETRGKLAEYEFEEKRAAEDSKIIEACEASK